MNNLPNWKHSSEVYSRAYRILKNMACTGHVSKSFYQREQNHIYKTRYVSDEMKDFIEALNEGNEEKIKWHILKNIKHLGGLMMWYKIFKPKYMFIPFAINHTRYWEDSTKTFLYFREIRIFGIRIITFQITASITN